MLWLTNPGTHYMDDSRASSPGVFYIYYISNAKAKGGPVHPDDGFDNPLLLGVRSHSNGSHRRYGVNMKPARPDVIGQPRSKDGNHRVRYTYGYT